KRRSRYRGWRDRGGPCRSQPRASEWIAGAGQADISGAGAAGFFVSGRRLVICGRIEFRRLRQRRKQCQHWQRRRLQHDDGAGLGYGSRATGAFQMINSTYTADISGAVAYDPDIAGSIVSGLAGQMDPATEAYAASYELRSDALLLQSKNISDPTVLDVRAVYQFGAGAGPAVATANDSANIAALTGLSAASLAANGLTSSSTVGDWRATVVAKLGSATANQTVLAQ